PPQHRLLPAPSWSAPCLPRLTGCCTARSPRTHTPAQAVPPAAPSSRNRQSPISSFTPICFYSRLVCPSEAEWRVAFARRLFYFSAVFLLKLATSTLNQPLRQRGVHLHRMRHVNTARPQQQRFSPCSAKIRNVRCEGHYRRRQPIHRFHPHRRGV